ncbi:MAG: GTPase ObgE [Chloroflexi bacterium]|nr:GTPase ObgE [Chloroflexota bacterium]MDA1219141.1 GTPase ObgE [Chloroflexota bacterium]
MIDTVRLNIKAGDGGNGSTSFLREKSRPMGGPNGGDGGDGGNAYIVGDRSLNTLMHLKFNSTFYVDRGVHGRGKDQRGANASDTYIPVPLGTVIWRIVPDSDGEKVFLADVIDETPVLVAQGGKGGWGNTHYVTPTNQAPMLSQQGEPGDWIVLFLELKLLADVGLLAKPNAGKSTLISRCSAAKPRIADFPFTTVEPILGVVSTRGKEFVMMEVPGLIEGAHEGIGLGDQFLRHAERARVYVHLIDGMSPDPVADYHMINDELRQFNPEMAEKPQIIAVSKMDVTDVRERREALAFVLEEEITNTNGEKPRIFFISAVSGEGIDQLLGCIVELLDWQAKEAAQEVSEPELVAAGGLPQVRRGNSVRMDGDVFVVESMQLERLSALADLRDYRVLLQLWREMTRMGIARRLQDAGIEAGDTIRIGRAEMEWF